MSSDSDDNETMAQASGSSKNSSVSMSALAKGVLMMPVLDAQSLGKKSSIEKFVKLFDNFLVNQPLARFAEGVRGDAWPVLSVLCPELPKKPSEVTNGVFRKLLLKMHAASAQPELLLRKWKKIKMKESSDGLVNLESAIQYFVAFLEAYKLTEEHERPRPKQTRDVFLEGIRPPGLRTMCKEKFHAKYKDVDVMLQTFLQTSKDQVTLQNKMSSFKEDPFVSAGGKSSEEVHQIVQAMVAEQLGVSVPVPDPTGNAPGLSKQARKRAKKVAKAKTALNTKLGTHQVIPDAEKVCYGCGHRGHGRDQCKHKDKRGFCKFPNKATRPMNLSG